MKKNTAMLTSVLLVLTMFLSSCGSSAGSTGAGSASSGTQSSRPDSPPQGAPSSNAPYPNADPSISTPPDGIHYLYQGKNDYTFGESYLVIDENRTTATDSESMLTFSLKVDTASYSNVQRYIESGSLPPGDAVRTEELVNYFRYDGDMRFGQDPFAIYTEVAPSPFHAEKLMAFIRVKAREIDKADLPRSSLTFLIDSSGSMDSYDKLPLLKESFSLLVETLGEGDIVSIVTYAGSSRIVLDSVAGADKRRIMDAVNSLQAGGSTAGGEGIVTAYKLAEKNFIRNGNNRIILATDGDFNVGVSSNAELSRLIRDKRESGVYLSILGFGMGNIRDDLMETLSKDGNGNYSYINSQRTAQKVLVEELAGNLFTVADDVKAQVEFNPDNVKSYRLIGYENRAMGNKDFTDDTKDAGDIGAGTDMIVLFEIELDHRLADSGRKYQSGSAPREPDSPFADELFEVRIRYKDPGEPISSLVTHPVKLGNIQERGSSDFNFACAVAVFADQLRGSGYLDYTTPARILSIAEGNLGKDNGGYRSDFLSLLNQYRRIAG